MAELLSQAAAEFEAELKIHLRTEMHRRAAESAWIAIKRRDSTWPYTLAEVRKHAKGFVERESLIEAIEVKGKYAPLVEGSWENTTDFGHLISDRTQRQKFLKMAETTDRVQIASKYGMRLGYVQRLVWRALLTEVELNYGYDINRRTLKDTFTDIAVYFETRKLKSPYDWTKFTVLFLDPIPSATEQNELNRINPGLQKEGESQEEGSALFARTIPRRRNGAPNLTAQAAKLIRG